MLKFDCEDNGSCRVYFRKGRALYCWQDETAWSRVRWEFYVCTSDGEPSHNVKTPDVTPSNPGKTRVGRDLNAYLTQLESPQCHA